MATWEDGPEYAPYERPSDFAPAPVAPLSMAPPVLQMAAQAPKQRPVFGDPPVPLAPLDTLVPSPAETRDPEVPFAVASTTMTADSAWGALHWSAPTTPPVTGPSLGEPGSPFDHPLPDRATAGPYGPPLPPPTSGPWSRFANGNGSGPLRPPPDSTFPAPGTPAWFGPGRYGEQPTAPGPVSPRAVWEAALPGLCICLLVGGLVYPVAPVLYGVAFALSGRVQVGRQRVRRAFAIGSGVLGIVAIIATLTNDFGFGEWWRIVGTWSLVACWALLATTLVLIYRALRNGEPPESPAPGSVWG